MFRSGARRALALAALTVVVAPAAAAAAGGTPRLAVNGTATAFDEDWRLRLAGHVEGAPFTGDLYGTVRPSNGVWPSASECVDVTVALVVDPPGRRELTFTTVGDLCRSVDDTAFVATGAFDTWGSDQQHLNGIQGTYTVAISDDGQATVTMTSR
jgi:hypothetical protein